MRAVYVLLEIDVVHVFLGTITALVSRRRVSFGHVMLGGVTAHFDAAKATRRHFLQLFIGRQQPLVI